MKTIANPNIRKLQSEIRKLEKSTVCKDRLIEDLKSKRLGPKINASKAFSSLCVDFCTLLFDMSPVWMVLSTLHEGIIVRANQAFYKITGYRESEVIGKSAIALGIWPDPKHRESLITELLEKKQLQCLELQIRSKDGGIHELSCSASLIESAEQRFVLSVNLDLSYQKALEEGLKRREHEVESLTIKLSEYETAIRIITEAWEKERMSRLLKLLRHLSAISPTIEKIRSSKGDDEIAACIKTVENLFAEIAPLVEGSRFYNAKSFTPCENRVIELIKQGMNSKAIACALALSTNTISFHRGSIRKKLGIKNTKTNLMRYLRTHEKLQ